MYKRQEESSEITPAPTAEEVQEQPEYSEVPEKEAEEFEYVDPGELVLGDHTQAEIDEALDNLASLGLEGEVYERAKSCLLYTSSVTDSAYYGRSDSCFRLKCTNENV